MHGEIVAIGGILVGNNPIASDAVATRLMGFDPKKIDHIVVASKYELGSYKEEDIDILNDISKYQQQFTIEPSIIDHASALCFKSNILNKIVSDSIFTKSLYNILGKEPRKKIVKPGDEI